MSPRKFKQGKAQNTVKWPYLRVKNELWAVILPVCSTNMVYLPANFQHTTPSNSQSYGQYTVWVAIAAIELTGSKFSRIQNFPVKFSPGKWPCKSLGIPRGVTKNTPKSSTATFFAHPGGTPLPPPPSERVYSKENF